MKCDVPNCPATACTIARLEAEILRLKQEVNEADCNLHSCAGSGDWDPPYPEVENATA